MASSDSIWTRTVYRLQNIPGNIQTPHEVAELLSREFGDVRTEDIIVRSLAKSLNSRKASSQKVATLMFKSLPKYLTDRPPSTTNWQINILVQDVPLVLDTHFLGLTPLNDVEPEQHIVDCVAISGLASHPFGSWAPKGDDKQFMWIRDELPDNFPGMRNIIYGYNTDMDDRTSFQSIGDLARDLIDRLGASRWKTPTSPKILFLAHSLGGILFKEAIVQLSKSREPIDKNLLDRIIGAILFGVPNLGMEQRHFLSIVEKQLNEWLIEELSRGSDFLRELDERFTKISDAKSLKVFWGYETRASPIYSTEADNNSKRRKASVVLVSQLSATSRMIHNCPERTFAINENHSELVKFPRESHYLDIIISKLISITASIETEPCYPPTILPETQNLQFVVDKQKQPLRPLRKWPGGRRGDILRKTLQKKKMARKQPLRWRKPRWDGFPG